MSVFRDRVKEAAEEVGGLNRLADLIKVPRRTLGDQIAEKTEPKVSLLVAIARETSFSIGWLATGEGPKREVDQRNVVLDAQLMEKLSRLVSAVHREAGIKLPPERIPAEAATLYNELAVQVRDLDDAEGIEAALPLLRYQLKKRLDGAIAEPGTGKREAS